MGYVSQGEEMKGGIFTNGPNVFDEQRFRFTSFYLPDMVDATEITNKKEAKVAIIELVNLDTPLDEKNTHHLDLDMTGNATYPYIKTRAGALQGRNMPWHYESKQSLWALVGGVSGLIAATAKVIR